MEYVKILAIGLVTTFAVLVVKQFRNDFAILIGVVGSILMLILISNQVSFLFAQISQIFIKTNIDTSIISSLLKIVGIGYITEFSANICNDTGCASIGDKILFCGKVLILFMSLPIINSLVDIIVGLLQ